MLRLSSWRSVVLLFGGLSLICAPAARADSFLVTLEGSAALPLTAPQTERFGAGGAAAISGYYALAPWLLLGGKLRAGLLSDGPAPQDPGLVDPGLGTLQTATALVRLRPFASDSLHYARGLFIEGGPSGALTGELVRPSVEAAIGFGLPLSSLTLAPVVRYVQVVQPTEVLSSEDARLLLFGLELSVLDAQPKKPARVVAPPRVEKPPADSDGDGIVDDLDQCVDSPEDFDGFEDEDGCPDVDNDGDGVLDASDRCPNEPEDFDGFEDEDGCPDPDNDQDGFLDADDQCPNEAEVINGVDDYDGCPDEGLIEMRNNRIVLEERVLFDFERARVKTGARPTLGAIVKLFSQHPEWIKIRIEGHADSRGDEQYNLELSERRAENVRKEMIRLGISGDIIDAVGFGSTKPRDMREDEQGFQRNRRVEFVVVAQTLVAVEPGQASAEPAAASEAAQEAPAEPQAEGAAP